MSQVLDVGEDVLALAGDAEHFLALVGGEELALFVEELQGVPFLGIV